VKNLSNPPTPAWIVGQWWTKGGKTVSQSTMNRIMTSLFYRTIPIVHASAAKGSAAREQKYQTNHYILRYLPQHGYTQWTRYQLAGGFWPFQWIEAGWLLGQSVLLIALTVWLVRRRAT
jgi:hypothetical protein